MNRYIYILLLILSPIIIYSQTIFRSNQVGSNPVSGYILQTDGSISTWVPNTGGGGSGGGSWSTTTSSVLGRLINYPNNTTDIVVIGSSATTTGKYWFDPNTLNALIGNSNTASTTIMGIINFPTVGQGLFYGGSGGRLNSIATTSVSCSGSVSCTAFTAIGASPITITGSSASTTLLSDTNYWSGRNVFTNSTTTNFGISNLYAIGSGGIDFHSNNGTPISTWGGGGGSNVTFYGGVNIDGATRLATSLTGLLKASSGTVSTAVNGTDYTLLTTTTCTGTDKVSAISASGVVTCSADQTGGSDPFTRFNGNNSATTTSMAIGTTTANNIQLTVSTSTAPQLSLSAGAGLSQWTMRNAGGNLYISTTTVDGTATTTIPAMTITNGGKMSIGTTTTTRTLTTFSTGTSTTFLDGSTSCLVMKDRDGVGYTYITVNNGVLFSSINSCE